jgi:hypothetical protein
MNQYQKEFRDNFPNAIWVLAKHTFLKIAYSYLIYTGLFIVLGGTIAAIAFTGFVDMDYLMNLPRNPNPEETLDMLKGLTDIFMTPGFLIVFAVLFILVLILASWNYYFAFITVDTEVKEKEFSFSQLLRLSINYGVVKVIGISLLMNLIMLVLFFAAIMSASISGFLSFVLFIVASITIFRFILVLPAYIIGNKDLNQAFAFSFYHINWLRALKLFGFSILAMLLIFVVALMIGLFSAVLSFIPIIGQLINMLINAALGAAMMTLIVSTVVGLYYRYAEDLIESNEDKSISE